jgi:cell division protein FtsQ
VLVGISSLLVAANRKQKANTCSEVLVGIRGAGEKFYIEQEDVVELIEKSANGSLVNKALAEINLSKLEKALEKNAWIKNAELYFDSKDALHVWVEERQPVARVFTTEGNSFYIDSSGHRMPLLEKMSARVPVVTGFTPAKKLNSKDSSLLDAVKQVSNFIYENAFWNAQIGQIDITADRKFELVPVIGDHIIRLGDADQISEKLERLFVFYKQVMSKTGFNTYAALDLQFNGQVVAIKKQSVSAVDSIQLKKNIDALMNRASLQNVEADMLPIQQETSSAPKDTTVRNQVPAKTNPTLTAPETQVTGAPKSTNQSKPTENRENEMPKAVMKREQRQ